MFMCKADSSGNQCPLPIKRPWKNEVLPLCSMRFFLCAQVWPLPEGRGLFQSPLFLHLMPTVIWVMLARDWLLYSFLLYNTLPQKPLPKQSPTTNPTKSKPIVRPVQFQDSIISLWMGLEWYLRVGFDARGIKIAACYLPCACHLFQWKEEALVAYNGHETSCILLRCTGANNPLF